MAKIKQLKAHEQFSALADAFQAADAGTPRTKEGNASYGFAKTGMPRSPAQMAAVKKAAAVSAENRHARAETQGAPAKGFKPIELGGTAKPKGPKKKNFLSL